MQSTDEGCVTARLAQISSADVHISALPREPNIPGGPCYANPGEAFIIPQDQEPPTLPEIQSDGEERYDFGGDHDDEDDLPSPDDPSQELSSLRLPPPWLMRAFDKHMALIKKSKDPVTKNYTIYDTPVLLASSQAYILSHAGI